MDMTQIVDVINNVTQDYEEKRIEELFSTAKGGSRITREDIPSVLAKAQTARDIRSLLFTALGFDV